MKKLPKHKFLEKDPSRDHLSGSYPAFTVSPRPSDRLIPGFPLGIHTRSFLDYLNPIPRVCSAASCSCDGLCSGLICCQPVGSVGGSLTHTDIVLSWTFLFISTPWSKNITDGAGPLWQYQTQRVHWHQLQSCQGHRWCDEQFIG